MSISSEAAGIAAGIAAGEMASIWLDVQREVFKEAPWLAVQWYL